MRILRLVDAILGAAAPDAPLFAITEERESEHDVRRATLVGVGSGPVPFAAGDRYPDPSGPWVVTARSVRPVGRSWKAAFELEERGPDDPVAAPATP